MEGGRRVAVPKTPGRGPRDGLQAKLPRLRLDSPARRATRALPSLPDGGRTFAWSRRRGPRDRALRALRCGRPRHHRTDDRTRAHGPAPRHGTRRGPGADRPARRPGRRRLDPLPDRRRDRPRRHGGRPQGPRPRPRPRRWPSRSCWSEYRDDPEMVRRFVEEAQIAGQLQHPGIVPVYELGRFADRRPVLRHEAGQGPHPGRPARRTAPPRPTTCRGSCRSSSRSCQTVAYAHARGVIHRDLKPSNVMVGAFGEVQVMDWGLAKVLPRGGVVDDAGAGPEPPQRDASSPRPGAAPTIRPVARRLGPGHARLHAPRAGPGRDRPGGRAGRRLRPGLDPLRDPHRQARRSPAGSRGEILAQGGRVGRPGRRPRPPRRAAGPTPS